MLDLAKSSIILFFQGNLFQNPSGVWRQLAIGIGLTLVIFLAAVKIAGFGLPLAAAIASFIGGAAHQLIGDVARFEAINAGWEEAQQTVVIAFRGAIEALSREALRKLIAGLKEAPGALDALRAAAAHPLVYAVLRRHG